MKLPTCWTACLALVPAVFGYPAAGNPAAESPSPAAAAPVSGAPICTGPLTSCPDQTTTTPTADHPFAVVADSSTSNNGYGSATHNWGTDRIGQGDTIDYDFVLQNAWTAPVQIANVQPTCGCTSVVADSSYASGTYLPVAPGATIKLHISIDPTQLEEGQADKLIQVYLKDKTAVAESLHMVGSMVVAVKADPIGLSFGTVKAGEAGTTSLKLTFDTQSYGGQIPAIKSGNSLIDIQPVGPDVVNGPQTVRTYDVSISPTAHIGQLQGSISVPYPKGDGGLTIWANAQIAGDIDSEPHVVVFGSVKVGQTTTVPVTLIGMSNGALKGLAVRSDSADITARIEPGDPKTISQGATDPVERLDVSLTPQQAGSVESTVYVTTKKGQVLDIKVQAWAE